MPPRIIRRIRTTLKETGIAQAVALARLYGIDEPHEFVLWFLAEPGQRVKFRNQPLKGASP